MNSYCSLKIWMYKLPRQDVKKEYATTRSQNLTAIQPDLKINPIFKGCRTAAQYQLFLLPLPKLLNLVDDILRNSKKITCLTTTLPKLLRINYLNERFSKKLPH